MNFNIPRCITKKKTEKQTPLNREVFLEAEKMSSIYFILFSLRCQKDSKYWNWKEQCITNYKYVYICQFACKPLLLYIFLHFSKLSKVQLKNIF